MSVNSDVLARLLEQATALHQGGRLDDAERAYGLVLSLAPRNFDALHRIAIIAMQKGLHQEALARIDRALMVDPGSPRAQFNRGTTLVALRRLDEAHNCFATVLQLDPGDGDAHFSLGNVELARERFAEAVASYDKALEAKPGDSALLSNRASALAKLSRVEDALASIETALEAAPGDADLHYNHGILARQIGRVDAAEASFGHAVTHNPRHAQAHNNLGLLLLESKRAEQALGGFERAFALGHAVAEYNRGLALTDLARPADALAAFERAIAAGHDAAEVHISRGSSLLALERIDEANALLVQLVAKHPDNAAAHYWLGVATLRRGKQDQAIACFERALAIEPDHADALLNCGIGHAFKGRRGEAVAHLDRALDVKPGFPAARVARCLAELEVVYPDAVAIDARRTAYARELEVLTAAVEAEPAAFARAFDQISPFYLAYQGGNDRELQGRYGAAICRVLGALDPRAPLSPPPRDGEPIRVGIVSAFFRNHSNWNMPIGGWVKEIDRKRFELFGYYTESKADAVTDAARPLFTRFVEGHRTIAQWRDEILADRLHVLIHPEIGMSPTGWQLAALRLAPVQCNSWGHPTTSGYPTIDYFLSSDLMEPPDADQHYSETLVRLPNLSVFCEPLSAPPAPAVRASLGLSSEASVLWCAQSIFKHHPRHDHVLARIAREVPGCQLVFIEYAEAPALSAIFLQRLEQAFAGAGLAARDHCVVLSGMAQASYRAAMGASDVFLDSLGWSGCNTIFEALALDMPIVTLPGDLMRGRHSKAILEMMGIDELIARDIDDYVAIAARLARDPGWRASIRELIASRKQRLFRDRASIEALERFLIEAAASGRRSDGQAQNGRTQM